RYGGEEFVAVLPETPCEDAVPFAERLREAVAGRPFRYASGTVPVTISVGVTGTTGVDVYTPQELIQRADQAMCRAKAAGRKCVRVWAGDELPPGGAAAPRCRAASSGGGGG